MRTILLATFTLILLQAKAQSIEGKWTGNYAFNILASRPQKLVVDIVLYNDTLVSGTSHLYHNRDNYEHYTVSGVYRKADSTIYFKEDSTIGVKLGFGVSNVLGNYTMKLRLTDTTMRFEGRWKENDGIGLMNSNVWLQKPIPRLPKTTDAPPIAIPKDTNLNRAVSIQKLIEIDEAEKDSIKIMIVDNGQIDGDIISVYKNDSLLLHNAQLTAKSLVMYLSVGKDNPLCRLTMVAQSQGSIPPCTARMTVITRKKHYDIDLASDASKSGTVQFFLKE